MQVKTKTIVIALLAFGLGLSVGIWWNKSPSTFEANTDKTASDKSEAELPEDVAAPSRPDNEVSSDAAETSSPEEASVPPPTVEVIVDNSPAPEAEVLAAHAVRSAMRKAMREGREDERRRLFQAVNSDWMTDAQVAEHERYVEAYEEQVALRRQIAGLRRDGEQVPAELQRSLSEVQSILRAGHATEIRTLREAAARAAGLAEEGVKQFIENLDMIDQILAHP